MDSMSSMFQNVGSAVQTAADAVRTDVREFFVGEDVGIGDGRAVGSGVGRAYCVLVKVELMQMLKPSSVVVESVKNDIDVSLVTYHPCGPRYPQKVTPSTVRPSSGQSPVLVLWM